MSCYGEEDAQHYSLLDRVGVVYPSLCQPEAIVAKIRQLEVDAIVPFLIVDYNSKPSQM